MDVTPTPPQPRPTVVRGKSATSKPTAAPPRLTQVTVKPVRRRKAATEQPESTTGLQVAADIDRRIAMTAYFLAEARNFEPGHELEDWLEAERRERGSQPQ